MITLSGRSIPKVPYRKMTEAEREEIRAYFKEDSRRNNDKFWQQTQEEAREVIKAIREGGFVVGEELPWGNPIDDYGVQSHVYPRNHVRLDPRESCDYNMVIGSVGLWESWGFSSNPIKVWYQNSDLIDDSLELREYLIFSGISFADSIDLQRLREENSRLEAKMSGNLKILNILRLKGIELRI